MWAEGVCSEEGGKTVQQNVNGPKETIVVQKVLLAIHQYTGPSGLPFPLICLCWSCNSSIVLPQLCSLAILSVMPSNNSWCRVICRDYFLLAREIFCDAWVIVRFHLEFG
jgi:hypothetical protein